MDGCQQSQNVKNHNFSQTLNTLATNQTRTMNVMNKDVDAIRKQFNKVQTVFSKEQSALQNMTSEFHKVESNLETNEAIYSNVLDENQSTVKDIAKTMASLGLAVGVNRDIVQKLQKARRVSGFLGFLTRLLSVIPYVGQAAGVLGGVASGAVSFLTKMSSTNFSSVMESLKSNLLNVNKFTDMAQHGVKLFVEGKKTAEIAKELKDIALDHIGDSLTKVIASKVKDVEEYVEFYTPRQDDPLIQSGSYVLIVKLMNGKKIGIEIIQPSATYDIIINPILYEMQIPDLTKHEKNLIEDVDSIFNIGRKIYSLIKFAKSKKNVINLGWSISDWVSLLSSIVTGDQDPKMIMIDAINGPAENKNIESDMDLDDVKFGVDVMYDTMHLFYFSDGTLDVGTTVCKSSDGNDLLTEASGDKKYKSVNPPIGCNSEYKMLVSAAPISSVDGYFEIDGKRTNVSSKLISAINCKAGSRVEIGYGNATLDVTVFSDSETKYNHFSKSFILTPKGPAVSHMYHPLLGHVLRKFDRIIANPNASEHKQHLKRFFAEHSCHVLRTVANERLYGVA